MQRCPCKDCFNRKLGCHGFCKDYQAWKEEHTRIKTGLDNENNLTIWRMDVARKHWRDMRFTYRKYNKK